MKTFNQIREITGRRPEGQQVVNKKLGRIQVQVYKERNGFVAYIDGDRLDSYKSSKEAEKARETMKISKNSFDPEIVVQKQKGPSAAETYYKDLLAFKEQLERAEKANKIAPEESQNVFKTPNKQPTLNDPNSAVSAASGKTDSPYSPYSPYNLYSPYRSQSSPLLQHSIGNADHGQEPYGLTSASDPNLSMRGSPSYEQLERLVTNDAASDATSGDSGPSSKTNTPATSKTNTPATSPPRKKNPTKDDGDTQGEMGTQDEPPEFGGKKKGKKGKTTKRANNAKKARKTKKKRSNKK